jgi:hypothetical protein
MAAHELGAPATIHSRLKSMQEKGSLTVKAIRLLAGPRFEVATAFLHQSIHK